MKKFLTLTLIISFLSLSVAVVYAQPQQRITKARRALDRPQSRILDVLKTNRVELNITDEQIEKIQNLAFSFKEKSLKMRNESSLSQLELQKLMQDRGNLDYDQIKAILSKTAESRNEMFVEGLKLREEINNVLTPEQREAVKAKTRDGIRNRSRSVRDRLQQRIPRLRNRIRR